MTQNRLRAETGFLVAFVVTAGTIAAVDFLTPWLNGSYTLPLILAPLIASLLGFWPGLLATMLSMLAVTFLFFEPINSFSVASTGDRVRIVIFGGLGVAMSTLGALRLRALRNSDRREAELNQLVRERELAENEERKRAMEQLQEADRRKDEFLATLAHELRNPLAPIQTGLDILKQMEVPSRVADIHAIIARQTSQLVKLVDDLLDVSRITRGRLELRKKEVDLVAVIDIALETSRPLIAAAHHELEVALPDEPICLEADPHRLAQVISNLLNNASKYTPPGGFIRLSVKLERESVTICVSDTGIGIPKDKLDTIFEMFAQIDRPLEKGYTGLGIGLTLSRSLIEMHRGRIEVYSEGEGKGSEFRICLPRSADHIASTKPEVPDPAGMAAKLLRVLVVDDNAPAAEMLSLLIGLSGHEVRTAADGEQAIESATTFHPNVVIMDLGMPKMNGYEAARHIREQSWGKSIKLIALTGWGQLEDKRRTREAGFDYHLVKPVSAGELRAVLDQDDVRDARPGKNFV